MARWKARGRRSISAKRTFIASSGGWGAMSGYWSKSRSYERGGSFWAHILRGMGVVHQRLLTSGKLESLGYHVALFAWSYVYPFWYNTGVWHTNRQTDTHTHTHTDTRWWLSPAHRLRRAGKNIKKINKKYYQQTHAQSLLNLFVFTRATLC